MLERVSSGGANASDCIARARDLSSLIVAHAARTEQERAIAPDVLAALHEARLFRMLLPRSVGGWEADPATFMQRDRGARQSRRQHRLVRHAGVGLLDDGGLSRTRRGAGGVRRRRRGHGLGSGSWRHRQGGAGGGRLSRDRHVELRERHQACDLARLSLSAVRARRHAAPPGRRQAGRAHHGDPEGAAQRSRTSGA